MQNEIMVLNKSTALYYLANEFGTDSLKVTTVLDDNGCWTNKIIIEGVPAPNFTDDAKYLGNMCIHMVEVDNKRRSEKYVQQ